MSRRGKFLLASVLLLAGAAWWVNRQLEPQRLTALVLDQAGGALGLKFSYSGEPDYAFRPEPRLLVPKLEARDPATGKLLLSAARADISLPWATITGGEPVITRIQLDGPSLDVPALRAWIAAQPPTPFKLPTLLKGLHVRNGTVVDQGYRVTALALDLPRLRSGEAAATNASGHFDDGKTAFDFAGDIALKTPGPASDFTLKTKGSLQHSPKPLAFDLRADGRYESGAKGFSLAMPTFAFAGDSPLPNLRGKLQVLIAEPMQLSFGGLLRDWPKDWPSLPAPLSEKSHDMDLLLDYSGARDISGPIHLNLIAAATNVSAQLKLPEVLAWLDANAGTPLPPLAATVSTPRIDVGSAQLQGVEIELHPDAPSDPSQ